MRTYSQLLYIKKVYNKIVKSAAAAKATHFLFPYHCVFCQAHTENHDICPYCLDDLPWIQAACARCAHPLPAHQDYCGNCISTPPPFHYSHSLLEFNWQAQFLIYQLKYQKNPAYAKLLAQLFIYRIKITHLPDALLAVPLHQGRLKQRGFNQSQLITNQLAKHYQIPIIQPIKRIKNTQSQTGLNKKQRENNLKNAFQITQTISKNLSHLAIIDDVLTTGATISELSQLLIHHTGIEKISVWTLARTCKS
ncbi:ComF family protein [Piscirickettsia salmonis]|uniref:ComF family protein n=1 Tax=Piscirickettsia salmonis TaxID=1238 RepID=UPI003752A913